MTVLHLLISIASVSSQPPDHYDLAGSAAQYANRAFKSTDAYCFRYVNGYGMTYGGDIEIPFPVPAESLYTTFAPGYPDVFEFVCGDLTPAPEIIGPTRVALPRLHPPQYMGCPHGLFPELYADEEADRRWAAFFPLAPAHFVKNRKYKGRCVEMEIQRTFKVSPNENQCVQYRPAAGRFKLDCEMTFLKDQGYQASVDIYDIDQRAGKFSRVGHEMISQGDSTFEIAVREGTLYKICPHLPKAVTEPVSMSLKCR